MQRGQIDLSTLPSAFDLQSTLESGQSYLWWREDGGDFADATQYGGSDWYLTTTRATGEPAVIRVRQRDGVLGSDSDRGLGSGNDSGVLGSDSDRGLGSASASGVLEWESTVDAEPVLYRRLRLDDDLDAIRATAPNEALVQAAYDAYWGMRLVDDPPFGTLISFICSAQMRVSRIHEMQQSLREAYGTPVEFDGSTYYAYPTPAQLAAASEQELRDLSLGYRAPYVQRSAELVVEGTPLDVGGLPYEEARDALTEFVGVGDKVADCILLFSLDYLEAVPLDTWIRQTIEEYYPECDCGNYVETSRAIREALGGEYAGYTQTYVFHFLRNGGGEDLPGT